MVAATLRIAPVYPIDYYQVRVVANELRQRLDRVQKHTKTLSHEAAVYCVLRRYADRANIWAPHWGSLIRKYPELAARFVPQDDNVVPLRRNEPEDITVVIPVEKKSGGDWFERLLKKKFSSTEWRKDQLIRNALEEYEQAHYYELYA